jgi:LacI family transcriptional regulator
VIAGEKPEPVVLPTRLMVRESTGPAKTGENR